MLIGRENAQMIVAQLEAKARSSPQPSAAEQAVLAETVRQLDTKASRISIDDNWLKTPSVDAIRSAAGLKSETQFESAPAAKRGFTDLSGVGAGRQLGLTARAAINGTVGTVNALFDTVVNVAVDGVNSVAGTTLPHSTTAADLQRSLTSMGLPVPRDATERVVQSVAGAMAGGAVMGKAAMVASELVTSAVTKAVTAQLGEATTVATVSAGTSGAGSSIVRENGGGPVAQIAAGLVGAATPVAALAAAKQAPTVAAQATSVAAIAATTVRLGNLRLPVGSKVYLEAPANPLHLPPGVVTDHRRFFPVEVRSDALVFGGLKNHGTTVQVYGPGGIPLSRFITNSDEIPITVPLTALPPGSTMKIELTGEFGRAHNPFYGGGPVHDLPMYSFRTNSDLKVMPHPGGHSVVTGSK